MIGLLKISRLFVAASICVAVTAQFLTFRDTPFHFFSYFTILSNLSVAIVFCIISFEKVPKKTRDFLRGAITLFMLFTGLGFIFLLGGDNGGFIVWISILLHYLIPFVVTADWFVISSVRISFKQALLWIAVLLLYLFYALILGMLTKWYPYSFLDHTIVGYEGLFSYIAVLFTAALLLTFVITKTSGRTKIIFL